MEVNRSFLLTVNIKFWAISIASVHVISYSLSNSSLVSISEPLIYKPKLLLKQSDIFNQMHR